MRAADAMLSAIGFSIIQGTPRAMQASGRWRMKVVPAGRRSRRPVLFRRACGRNPSSGTGQATCQLRHLRRGIADRCNLRRAMRCEQFGMFAADQAGTHKSNTCHAVISAIARRAKTVAGRSETPAIDRRCRRRYQRLVIDRFALDVLFEM